MANQVISLYDNKQIVIQHNPVRFVPALLNNGKNQVIVVLLKNPNVPEEYPFYCLRRQICSLNQRLKELLRLYPNYIIIGCWDSANPVVQFNHLAQLGVISKYYNHFKLNNPILHLEYDTNLLALAPFLDYNSQLVPFDDDLTIMIQQCNQNRSVPVLQDSGLNQVIVVIQKNEEGEDYPYYCCRVEIRSLQQRLNDLREEYPNHVVMGCWESSNPVIHFLSLVEAGFISRSRNHFKLNIGNPFSLLPPLSVLPLPLA